MSSEACCLLRELASRCGAVPVGNHWTINICECASSRPWLVIQSLRHVTSLGDLSEEESRELGALVAQISQHLESLPTVQRAYILSFNETDEGHVHVHFTVSVAGDTVCRGTQLFGAELPADSPRIPRELWWSGLSSRASAA